MFDGNKMDYINPETIDGWVDRIRSKNDELKAILDEIQRIIRDDTGALATYEGKSANEIRQKIVGMTPKFQDYYNVVDNYKVWLSNTSTAIEQTDETLQAAASQFV